METSSTEEQQQQAEQLNQARKAHESKVLIQAYLQILAATMPQAERQALMSDPVSARLLTSSPVARDLFSGSFPDEGERRALLEDVSPPVDYNPRGRFLPDEGPSPSSTGYNMISESFPDDGMPPPRPSSSSSTSSTVSKCTTTHFVWMAFFVAIVGIGLGFSHI